MIVGLLYLQSTTVFAHGDMREVFKGSVDGYGISVKTIPHELAVGQAHFTIEPTELESGKPIVEALVTLLVHLEKEAFKSRAVNSPSSPTMYDANLTFLLLNCGTKFLSPKGGRNQITHFSTTK